MPHIMCHVYETSRMSKFCQRQKIENRLLRAGENGDYLLPGWFLLLRRFRSVQSLSHVQLFATPWTAVRQASLSITNSRSPPKPMSIESVMPSSHLILCCPLLLLPPIPPSIRVFSNQSTIRMRWPEYWSFSLSISPSNEHPGLVSFRMDWLDLLLVQGTLKSLLQHHSSKASILRCSAFFIVQLSHPYTTTGKTTALTRRTFVDKVINILKLDYGSDCKYFCCSVTKSCLTLCDHMDCSTLGSPVLFCLPDLA